MARPSTADAPEAPPEPTTPEPESPAVVLPMFPATLGTNLPYTGNLTRDWQVRYTKAGQAVASNALAINGRRRHNGEFVDTEPTFIELMVFGSSNVERGTDGLIENILESAPKGTRVMVTGDLRARRWQTETSRGTAIELIVREFGVSLRFAKAEVSKNVSLASVPEMAQEEPF